MCGNSEWLFWGHVGLVVSMCASYLRDWGFNYHLCPMCVESVCSPCDLDVSFGYSRFLHQSKWGRVTGISKLSVVCERVCSRVLQWVSILSMVSPEIDCDSE